MEIFQSRSPQGDVYLRLQWLCQQLFSVFADVSSQAAIAAGGALTLNAAAITGQTDFTGVLENTDELMFSDGGVLKKMDML